ncbi:hypothetical protein ACHAW6_012208 [Cyclotella cf. meneghiniana]
MPMSPPYTARRSKTFSLPSRMFVKPSSWTRPDNSPRAHNVATTPPACWREPQKTYPQQQDLPTHEGPKLVPPGCHCCNAAEVAICNFKAHFLSFLAGTAESFPPSLWDRLLPQTKIMLNLLRQSNATPTVSAYAHLAGPFDYNKMPLAPMGCEVQVHKKTDKRGTWLFTVSTGGI